MALQLVKEQHKKVIGLITPGAPKRKPSWQLKKYANFLRALILLRIFAPTTLRVSGRENSIKKTHLCMRFYLGNGKTICHKQKHLHQQS
jgi:hypothetical protein